MDIIAGNSVCIRYDFNPESIQFLNQCNLSCCCNVRHMDEHASVKWYQDTTQKKFKNTRLFPVARVYLSWLGAMGYPGG